MPFEAVTPNDLQIGEKLGDELFGNVFKAIWRNTYVAVKFFRTKEKKNVNNNDEKTLFKEDNEADNEADNEKEINDKKAINKLFTRELVSLGKVTKHPNVVSFLAYCHDPPSLVMELCTNGTLHDLLFLPIKYQIPKEVTLNMRPKQRPSIPPDDSFSQEDDGEDEGYTKVTRKPGHLYEKWNPTTPFEDNDTKSNGTTNHKKQTCEDEYRKETGDGYKTWNPDDEKSNGDSWYERQPISMGFMGWRKCIHFSIGIARGIAHVHSKAFVHRDLHLNNILLDVNSQPKIADMGLSEHQYGSTSLMDYMNNLHPPELQQPGEMWFNYSYEGDVWMYGAILLQMVLQTKMFTAEQVIQRLKQGEINFINEVRLILKEQKQTVEMNEDYFQDFPYLDDFLYVNI